MHRSYILLLLCCALGSSLSYLAVPRLAASHKLRAAVPMNIVPTGSEDNDSNNDDDNVAKKEALEILDCLTSTIDVEDVEFDENNYERRLDILNSVDYSDLKVELKTRGLKTGGDKLEMVMRLLLHIVDPQIKFSESTGTEPQLEYIDDKDLAGDKTVRLNPISLRRDSGADFLSGNIDADDMKVLSTLGDSDVVIKTPAKVMTDGMTRQEVEIPLVTKLASEQLARKGRMSMLATTVDSVDMYIVSSRAVLRRAEDVLPVVILLADGPAGGVDKEAARAVADEIAFANQCVVALPDIFSVVGAKSSPAPPSSGGTRGTKAGEAQETLLAAAVSAMLHCRADYAGSTLLLAGVGRGAGQALRLATYVSRAKKEESADAGYLRSIVRDDSFCNVAGVLAIEPSDYDGVDIGTSLETSTLLIFSEEESGGAGDHSSNPNNLLYKALQARGDTTGFDCGFRVYQKLHNRRYLYRPQGELEAKYRTDTISVGSTWLDCVSRREVRSGGVAVDIFSF